MIRDLKLIKNIDLLFEKKIVLYGASGTGKEIFYKLKEAGIQINYFCDSNPEKWGKEYIEGATVLSLEDLIALDKNEDIVIIITSIYTDEIINKLDKLELSTQNVFTLFGLHYSLVFGQKNFKLNESFRNKYHILLQAQIDEYKRLGQNNIVGNIRANEWLDMMKNDKVIILSPAKVGTSTIYKTLKENGIKSFFLHDITYYFVHKDIGYEEKRFYMNELKKKEKIKIISAVREPISRDISLFFQYLEDHFIYLFNGLVDSDLCNSCTRVLERYTIKKPFIDALAFETWHDWIASKGNHGIMFDWFELEIKDFFNIDIYAIPFNKEAGYTIYRNGNVELFIYRLENIKDIERPLAEFLNTEPFNLLQDNLSSEKWYKYAYRELKQNIKLSKQYIDFYYKQNERMDYFYSSLEKQRFLESWKSINENFNIS